MFVSLSPNDSLDRELFETMILEAAASPTPVYVCDIETDPALFEQHCAEGRMRAEANARMRGGDWKGQHQHTPGSALTIDELGRVAEGAIEAMLGLDVAAVLEDSTDDRPDKTLAGVKFDVKGSFVRPGNTFALPCWQVATKGYDSLLLVQHLEPGKARVWCCKCQPGGEAWTKLNGVRGKGAFWRISCPNPQA